MIEGWLWIDGIREPSPQALKAPPLARGRLRYLSLGPRRLVRLFPISFIVFAASVWTDLLWWRLPRRETILNILAILALAYLAWSVIQIQLEA